jgi:hypothetical protein
LIFRDWKVRVLQKGVYRIDSDPPRLQVVRGKAEVFAGAGGPPVAVETGMSIPFAGVLVPEPSNELPGDALSSWANGRGQSIAADNAIAAQIDEDPALRTSGLDTFTYFPYLGVPSASFASSGSYGTYNNTYQPGFNSLYLPGYTYRPLIIGLLGGGFVGGRSPGIGTLGTGSPGTGFRTYQPSPSPIHTGIGTRPGGGFSPGSGTVIPIPRGPTPVGGGPVAVRPSAPVHSPPHGAVHAGAHR